MLVLRITFAAQPSRHLAAAAACLWRSWRSPPICSARQVLVSSPRLLHALAFSSVSRICLSALLCSGKASTSPSFRLALLSLLSSLANLSLQGRDPLPPELPFRFHSSKISPGEHSRGLGGWEVEQHTGLHLPNHSLSFRQCLRWTR